MLSGKASLTGKPPLLSYKDFYISCLDHTDLMADFFAWQNHNIANHHRSLWVHMPFSCSAHVLIILACLRKYSYCQYPFVLSLSAKKHILQHDSQHRMLMVAMVRRRRRHEKQSLSVVSKRLLIFASVHLSWMHTPHSKMHGSVRFIPEVWPSTSACDVNRNQYVVCNQINSQASFSILVFSYSVLYQSYYLSRKVCPRGSFKMRCQRQRMSFWTSKFDAPIWSRIPLMK